jgi:hypothetical protein
VLSILERRNAHVPIQVSAISLRSTCAMEKPGCGPLPLSRFGSGDWRIRSFRRVFSEQNGDVGLQLIYVRQAKYNTTWAMWGDSFLGTTSASGLTIGRSHSNEVRRQARVRKTTPPWGVSIICNVFGGISAFLHIALILNRALVWMATEPPDTLSIQTRKIWRYAGCSYITHHYDDQSKK